jgi:hypothetical protein
MKSTLKKFAILSTAAFSLIQPLCASAWTTRIDCEGGGGLGTKLLETPPNNFTSTFTRSVYSNERVASGSQSCKMGISKGAEGFGEWGAIYSFPSKLSVGSQLWIRVKIFVPESFNYTANPHLKFMRVHTASPSVGNHGYLDLYITPPTGTVYDQSLKKDVSAPFLFYYEGNPRLHTLGQRPLDNVALGKWESYEINYKLDTKSKDDGGTGEIKIWKNNKLLTDLTDQITLVDATTYAESFFLFTYWNGNAPATQSLFVDDIVITSDTPSNRDAQGNPFIGGATTGPVPLPPSSLMAR